MNLIPIVGPIMLMGWQCEILQRLLKRHSNPIPKLTLDDFGYWLGRGLAPFVIVLIVTVPVVFVVVFVMFLLTFGMAVFAGAFAQQGGEPNPLLPLIGVGASFLTYLAFMIVFGMLVTSVLIRAELTEDIGQALEFRKIWAYVRSTWKDVLISQLVFIPFAFAAALGGMLMLFFGIYAAIIVIMVASLHIRWQIYERYLSRGGEPIPIQTKSGPLPSEQKVAVAST
ncbi:MAG TPA: DUF4013 domain-containing protein [bacterium]|nr:DUF4013 domain-containing protein [bacterium]